MLFPVVLRLWSLKLLELLSSLKSRYLGIVNIGADVLVSIFSICGPHVLVSNKTHTVTSKC